MESNLSVTGRVTAPYNLITTNTFYLYILIANATTYSNNIISAIFIDYEAIFALKLVYLIYYSHQYFLLQL